MENTNVNNEDKYQKQNNKEEMQRQMISFVLMIVLTLIAFMLVATGQMSKMFIIPVLVILAAIQVGFQFYYFMHMKEKGHGMPALLIYGGTWAALSCLAGLGVISWW